MSEEEKSTLTAAEEKKAPQAMSVIVRSAANLLLPLACTFGGYVVLHGDTSPGGGFQGGVAIAAAVLLVFLAYGGEALRRFFHTGFLHDTETIAEIIYVAIGLVGVFAGLTFAMNFILDSLHIETALLMNHAVGYHVMAGVSCLLIALLGMLTAPKDEQHAIEDPGMADETIPGETASADAKEETK